MMHPEESDYLSRQALRRRLMWYFMALLVTQSLLAYGALLLFDALPNTITGLPDEATLQRAAQRGAVGLVREHILSAAPGQEKAVVQQLQPGFGYPLQLIAADTPLPEEMQEQLRRDTLAYNAEDDTLVASINETWMLQIGPIVTPDILEANAMATMAHLLLWSVLSAVVFFVLLYIALAPLWIDALVVRDTVSRLARGQLQSRAPRARSWLFRPLSNVLNDMATQIEHLVQGSKIMSQTMAHELRTPVARMHFALSMLEDAETAQQYRHYARGLHDDVHELESLINVSLDYFRLQQHKAKVRRSEVPLQAWVQSVCAALHTFRPEKFVLDTEVSAASARIDEKFATIVLQNLLLNAFKYACNHAHVQVRRHGDGGVRIEVDDDGPGIPPEARERVFAPFVRLDASRVAKAEESYGLGLAYVRLIAELHRGSAFVLSSPLGGARFVVVLEGGAE